MTEIQRPHRSLDDILDAAVDDTGGRILYVNNVRFTVGVNEVTMDLYFVAKSATDTSGPPAAHYVSRVVLPIAVAKEASQKLLRGVNRWEKQFGVKLPLGTREASEIEEAEDASITTRNTAGSGDLAVSEERSSQSDLTIDDLGWSPEYAAQVRSQFATFAEDWDDPAMDIYDELYGN